MDQGARFPSVGHGAGHYESFYIKACAPGGGRGVWIRHTVHKRPGLEPTASLWVTVFDRGAGGPRATKVTVPASELSAPADAWIRIGDAELAPGRATCPPADNDRSGVSLPSMGRQTHTGAGGAVGAVGAGEAVGFSWDLEFSGAAEPCQYLPAEWLYRAPLPRTKFVAPYPDATFNGSLRLGEETVELDGWPGMIGHNWGSEHAERWIWMEGTGFEGSPGTYFDTGAARVKLGPWTTPWVPAGMIALEGVQHRLGGLAGLGTARIEESPEACSFVLPGRDIVVRGRVSAPKEDFVGWVYADPDGPEHNTVNCSVADLELTVERPAERPLELRLPGGAAYELGMRETDHGIPIQPFPDG